MRLELYIILIAGFIIANIYTDGKYTKMLTFGKKYYQMAGVAFGALMLYILFKKNPLRAQQMIGASNEYLRYLPIDRNTSNMISPILDFTSKQNMSPVQNGGQYNNPIVSMPDTSNQYAENRIMNSGKNQQNGLLVKQKRNLLHQDRTGNVAIVKHN